MKVVVRGAGIAGLTVADRLVRGGAEVVVLERSSGPDRSPTGHCRTSRGPTRARRAQGRPRRLLV